MPRKYSTSDSDTSMSSDSESSSESESDYDRKKRSISKRFVDPEAQAAEDDETQNLGKPIALLVALIICIVIAAVGGSQPAPLPPVLELPISFGELVFLNNAGASSNSSVSSFPYMDASKENVRSPSMNVYVVVKNSNSYPLFMLMESNFMWEGEKKDDSGKTVSNQQKMFSFNFDKAKLLGVDVEKQDMNVGYLGDGRTVTRGMAKVEMDGVQLSEALLDEISTWEIPDPSDLIALATSPCGSLSYAFPFSFNAGGTISSYAFQAQTNATCTIEFGLSIQICPKPKITIGLSPPDCKKSIAMDTTAFDTLVFFSYVPLIALALSLVPTIVKKPATMRAFMELQESQCRGFWAFFTAGAVCGLAAGVLFVTTYKGEYVTWTIIVLFAHLIAIPTIGYTGWGYIKYKHAGIGDEDPSANRCICCNPVKPAWRAFVPPVKGRTLCGSKKNMHPALRRYDSAPLAFVLAYFFSNAGFMSSISCIIMWALGSPPNAGPWHGMWPLGIILSLLSACLYYLAAWSEYPAKEDIWTADGGGGPPPDADGGGVSKINVAESPKRHQRNK